MVNPPLAKHVVDKRLIVIGDVHGCYDELVELLDRVKPRERDVVVSVGDMVRKGPDAAKCLDLWRERGYLAVAGNNEISLLAHATPILRFFAVEDRDVLRRSKLLKYIRSWPLAIDFENAGVAIVHGGFLPGMRVRESDIERERDIVHHLRWIRRQNGRWKPVPRAKRKKRDRLWSDVWEGERFVVYGHTPTREPRINDHALGLDTGCVYGGSLTAAILENGEWSFVSVPARRAYV
ncbi:MAG TPA: metallophosphoesterase [Thermoanaerobaculia bacterium]|nr:metallophosphoesterase [Thermoanaerobaculia bacterium]